MLSSKEVFLYDPNGAVSNVQTVDRATGKGVQATSVTQVQPASSWWDVVFPSDVFTITNPPQNLDLDYSVGGKAASSLQVSLSLKVSIAIGTNGAIIRTYFLNSNIVLQNSHGYLIASDSAACGRFATGGPKAFALKDKSKTKTLHGTLWSCTVPVDQVRINPAQAGAIKVTLDYSLIWRQNSFTIDSDSGNALLDGITVDPSLIPAGQLNRVTFSDDSTFNPQSGPTTKDAASVYANLQIAAGTGAKGAWGLDGKIAYWNVPVAHGALTVLSATANTGNNTSNIKTSTYTDTIDWMLPVSWAFSLLEAGSDNPHSDRGAEVRNRLQVR